MSKGKEFACPDCGALCVFPFGDGEIPALHHNIAECDECGAEWIECDECGEITPYAREDITFCSNSCALASKTR